MEDRDRPRCGARLKSGTGTCRQAAGARTDHLGYGQCWLHGGATPTGKKHAKTLRQEAWDRIVENIDPMLTRLDRLSATAESEAVQFSATKDWLDRAGMGAKHVHEHTGPDGGPIPVEVRTAELLGRARKLRPPVSGKPRKPASKQARKRASEQNKQASKRAE